MRKRKPNCLRLSIPRIDQHQSQIFSSAEKTGRDNLFKRKSSGGKNYFVQTRFFLNLLSVVCRFRVLNALKRIVLHVLNHAGERDF